jgi:hypothetical protein
MVDGLAGRPRVQLQLVQNHRHKDAQSGGRHQPVQQLPEKCWVQWITRVDTNGDCWTKEPPFCGKKNSMCKSKYTYTHILWQFLGCEWRYVEIYVTSYIQFVSEKDHPGWD